MECPYKRECATVRFWAEEKKDFIQEVCNTNKHRECLHFATSLDPQHKERERLYGNPHAYEPDWNEVARKGGVVAEQIVEGMHTSDRCQFCHEFGEKVEPFLCAGCKQQILNLGFVRLPSPYKTAAILALQLGLHRFTMYENYPDNFNKEIVEIAEELHRSLREGG